MLTVQQIKWASHHDWFVKDNGDGTIIVRDSWSFEGRAWWIEGEFGGSFRQLRDWAGY